MTTNDKILFIVPSFTKAGIKGYEKVTLQWIEALRLHYSIHIINLGGTENTKYFDDDLRVTVHNRKSNMWRQLLQICYAILTLAPLQTRFLYQKCHSDYLEELHNIYKFKLSIFVTIRSHSYSNTSRINQVMLAIDSMELNFHGKYRKSGLLMKLPFLMEYTLLKFRERLAFKHYKDVIFVSERDAHIYNGIQTKIIPLSIQLPLIKSHLDIVDKQQKCLRLIFTGNMSYEPNRTAVAWFDQHISQSLSHSEFKYQILVCGRFANSWAFLAQHPIFKVKSDVPNIIDEIVLSDIYIAPMQSGSGMQYKILEAMACGKPVITSTLGLGSIKCRGHLKDIIVADTADDVRSAIRLLSEDVDLRTSIGLEARKSVLQNYSVEQVGHKIVKLVNDN